MKTKLMTLALAALPIAFSSCKKAETAATDAADQAKETATKAADAVAAFPTDMKGLAGLAATQLGGVATQLEGVTDLESAKKALPALDKIGGVMAKIKKATESLGGDSKMKELVESTPDLKEKIGGSMGKIMTKMMDLGQNQPEAAKLISEKMQSIMK